MSDAFDSSRRQFLKVLATTGAAAGAGWLTGSRWGLSDAEAALAGRGEILELTATEAVAVMAAGDLRAETYAATLLARATSLKNLNVLISQDRDQVLEAARAADRARARGRILGPLHGLPLLIKDGVNSATLPTTAGTPSLIDNRPRANARVLDALLSAGGILFGKANMHELAYGVTSNNATFGLVRNPYDAPHLHPSHGSRLQRWHPRGERADRADERWVAGRPGGRRARGERPAIAGHREGGGRSLRVPARAPAGASAGALNRRPRRWQRDPSR